MAVQPQTPYKEYTATSVFPLGFDCKDKDHLIVMIDDAETDNSAWSLNNDQVTFNVAPDADKKITLQRNTPYRRDRNYQAYDNSFRPGPVNDDFDWIWWKLQELGVADWILGTRIDALKNYVDRKDDELKAYLMEEIRKQGVALDQLDEYYNYLIQRLAQIAVDKGWDASFVVDGDKNQHQINTFVKSLLISPMLFGAKGNGVDDDSVALNNTINFAIANNATLDGQGKTYACHSVLFDSNFKFKNANLVCNKFDQDLISVLECSSYNDDPQWLENVYLENIHIDGKRALHTGIKGTTTQEDGGRSGFRFIRPVDGLKMVGCSANDCASDGIIIFPHGDRSSVNNTVKNVEIINSTFNGNRRHGGSSSSVNGMVLSNVTCNGNGLDINPFAPIDSGLRGDTVGNGQLYGSGWDCEEYAFDVQSTNMFFNDCTMIENARSGLLVLTVGSPSGTNKAIIEVNGGSYDIGVSSNRDNWAILVTPVTDKRYPSTKLLTLNKVNVNGGDAGGRGVDAFLANHLINVGAVRALEMTNLYVTGNFIATAEAATSNVYKTFNPSVSAFNYANNLLQLNTTEDAMEIRVGIMDSEIGHFKLSAYKEVERGALTFRMNVGTGGTDLYYSSFGQDKVFFSDGSLLPASNGGYSLGFSSKSFNNLYLVSSPIITSDLTKKVSVTSLSDSEQKVAIDLKNLIKKYKMKSAVDEKGDSARWHIGIIAQEVEQAFKTHNLDAFEYGLLCKDESEEGGSHYAIRYDELNLFILSAM